jgi:protein-tyrosine-phosphatase
VSGEIRTIAVVCSANQCRSPVGAALLTREFARRGHPVQVTSSGVQARAGSPATSGTVRAARELGIDLRAHRSQPTTREQLVTADLILGMERMHLREVVVLEPQLFSRAFTLKELVRRGDDVGPRRPGQSQAEWLLSVHQGRRPTALMGSSDDDDVADPTTDMTVEHETMADEIDDLVGRLVDLLWPVGVV